MLKSYILFDQTFIWEIMLNVYFYGMQNVCKDILSNVPQKWYQFLTPTNVQK